jgi:anion-transporting  ArsA/GET3 family ATPase
MVGGLAVSTQPVRSTISKPLELVVGKGGVGKSTVAAALATCYAAAGYRTLAVELAAPAGLAEAFGATEQDAGEARQVGPNLWYSWIDGETALAEYLALIVPVRRVLATVLDSRVYRYFVAAAPGLKELMTIGKLWYEHERESDNGKVWDRIVVDAGASGHSLQYLRMPDAAAKTFGKGLVRRESEKLRALLRDDEETAVHVVATPESMPLTEAAEIVSQLRGELDLPLGSVFVNRCRSAPPEGSGEAVNAISRGGKQEFAPLLASAQRALSWYALQEETIRAFIAETGIEPVRLPLVVAEEFGRREIVELSTLLDDSAAATEVDT